jgi:DNA replication protein DnaC
MMTSDSTPIHLLASLATLGLRLSEDAFKTLLAEASKAKWTPVQLLQRLVEVEQQEREDRNLAHRAKTACLGSPKALDQFDWLHPRKLDKALYEALYSSGEFIENGHNVLFRGRPGIGKTTLAQHLGLRALQLGYTVKFATLPAALADLLRQESLPATERRLQRYTKPDLLILDELGYVPVHAAAADLLFHIISRRHEKRPTIITTNLAYKQWPTVFREASCLGALIDRFAQHCHTLDIDADSWRNKRQVMEEEADIPLT